MGPQGLQGDVGPAGFDGLDGMDGFDGLDGLQGPQGFEGPAGPQGDVGPQGPAGPTSSSIVLGTPGTTTSLLRDSTATSSATCPVGTVLLGGGSRWVANATVSVPADHRKIGVTDRTQAAVWAVRKKLA